MLNLLNKKTRSIFIISLAIIVSGLIVFASQFYGLCYRPMPNPTAKSITIQIKPSMSAADFAQVLYQHHLISSKYLFRFLIRLQGLSSQLKAGIYKITAGESAGHFLYRVVDGDILVENFRIVEGTTLKRVDQQLASSDYLNYRAEDWSFILESLQQHSLFSKFIAVDQVQKGVLPNAEGLLLADTYYYKAGSDSKDLLIRAHENLRQYLEFCWQHRLPGLPYRNPYQLLIAASILEKEASLPSERRLISGVIVNRLRKYMPLQMDPTVIYALGTSYAGKLTHNDLKINSPYNSYRYRGLPPTPIAMVGKDALDAAAHPQMTNYLYFVAKGDGQHQFSTTYAEQQQAVKRYLKAQHAN